MRINPKDVVSFAGRDYIVEGTATYHLGGTKLEAVQAKQPGRLTHTVLTQLGPPPCRPQTSPSSARPQVLFWRLLPHPQQGTAPCLTAKSPNTYIMAVVGYRNGCHKMVLER